MIGSELVLAEIIRQSLDGRSQVFTANGSFVVPPGITRVFITATAAGNNGAAGVTATNDGGAGGRGGSCGERVINYPITVTPGQSISITVGTGNTVFGTSLTLVKGNGQAGGMGGAGGTAWAGASSGGSIRPGATTFDLFGNGLAGARRSGDYDGGGGGKGGCGAPGLMSLFSLPGAGAEGGNGGDGGVWGSDLGSPGLPGTDASSFDYGAGGGGGGGGGGCGSERTVGGTGGPGGAGSSGILIVRW